VANRKRTGVLTLLTVVCRQYNRKRRRDAAVPCGTCAGFARRLETGSLWGALPNGVFWIAAPRVAECTISL
jgi:hypothetical protein